MKRAAAWERRTLWTCLLAWLALAAPAHAQFAVLSSLTIRPATVCGGVKAVGTVTLNQPAPANGVIVLLSSSDKTVAAVPASVTILGGQTATTFDVVSQQVSRAATVTVTASAGVTKTATLTVVPPAVTALSLKPAVVCGGEAASGTVTINCPAPPGGLGVALASNDVQAASVPSSITIAEGQTQAEFSVTTFSVAATEVVTITASKNGSKTSTLTIKRPTLSGQPRIPAVKVEPMGICGGENATGTLTLDCPAPPGGAEVAVSSSNPQILGTPTTVVIPAGQISATFTVTTRPVAQTQATTVTAIYGVTQKISVRVLAPTLTFGPPLDLYGISFSPSLPQSPSAEPVCGGESVTGSVNITCPAPPGGAAVTLTNSNTNAATGPAYVLVPEGSTSATFTVKTRVVAATAIATFTARYGGIEAQATVTAKAPGFPGEGRKPPAFVLSADTVRGGAIVTGTLHLDCPALNTGAKVFLSSSRPGVASVPAIVFVPPGATVQTFPVTTYSVVNTLPVVITATLNGDARTAPLTVRKRTAFDFNADGFGDLLFQNAKSRAIGTYGLRGVSPTTYNVVFDTFNPQFVVAGAPDLNRDGFPDLVFSNPTTGAVTYSLLRGTQPTRYGTIFQTTDLNFALVGTPDLNGDNYPDLVFQHKTTGAVVYWLLDENQQRLTFGTIFERTDLRYKIVGTGDLNNDNRPDLLFQDAGTGALVYWLLDGVMRLRFGTIFSRANPDQRLAGVFDLNGDGRADVVYQNRKTAGVTYWLLSETLQATSSGTILAAGNPDAFVVGVH